MTEHTRLCKGSNLLHKIDHDVNSELCHFCTGYDKREATRVDGEDPTPTATATPKLILFFISFRKLC